MSSRRWSESKMRGLIHGKKQKDHQQERGQDDKMETLLWVNRTLANGGNSQYVINDITRDLCDGVALIKLLESMTRTQLIYHSPPLSRSQKLNNVQMVLNAVSQRGVSVAGINSEDVFKGNVKVILNLCHRIQQGITVKIAIMRSFVALNGQTNCMTFKGDSPKVPPQSSFQKDSLLVWAETILNCKIRDYSDFRDGRYFCDIINSLHHHGKNVLLPSSSAQKCLTDAVQAAEMHLGLHIGPFDVIQVTNGENDTFIRVFLQHLKNVKPQNDIAPFQGNDRYSNDRIGSRVLDEDWYKGYGTPEGSREFQKTHSVPTSDDSPNYIRQESSNSLINEQIRDGKGNQHKLRTSYSTDHLNSHSNSGSYQSLQFNGNGYKIPGSKNRQRLADELPVAMQPDSTPNRGSYRQPDMRTSQITSSYPNIGPQPYSLPKHSDRVGGARHSVPSTVTTVEYSYSNDLPMPVTIYRTSSRSSIHSTSSRSSMDRGSTTDEQHITLAHLSSHQSSIPPHLNLPEYQTEKSLRETYSRKRSGSSNSLSNAHLTGAGVVDRLPPAIDNLDRRLVELSEIMLEEKVVLMKKTYKRVAMETRKRRQLEKRFEDYVKTSKNTIQRYESCLVHLGKEVSRLSTELSNVKEQMSVMHKPNSELSSHTMISPGESSGTAEKGKKSIFSRKPK